MILIGGDSWGCGEWGPDSKIRHRGLEQYFIDKGYSVRNSSKGESSNKKSIQRLEKDIDQYHDKNNIVLWLQSDPIRNVMDNLTLTEEIKKSDGLYNLIEKLIVEDYAYLNNLAETYDITIHCIGALTNIQNKLISNFKNLNPLVPSWNHLLVGNKSEFSDWKNNIYLGITSWNINDIDLKLYDQDLQRKVVNEMYELSKYWDMFRSLKDIYPDGCHPSRQGHKTLFDYIVKELNL